MIKSHSINLRDEVQKGQRLGSTLEIFEAREVLTFCVDKVRKSTSSYLSQLYQLSFTTITRAVDTVWW